MNLTSKKIEQVLRTNRTWRKFLSPLLLLIVWDNHHPCRMDPKLVSPLSVGGAANPLRHDCFRGSDSPYRRQHGPCGQRLHGCRHRGGGLGPSHCLVGGHRGFFRPPDRTDPSPLHLRPDPDLFPLVRHRKHFEDHDHLQILLFSHSSQHRRRDQRGGQKTDHGGPLPWGQRPAALDPGTHSIGSARHHHGTADLNGHGHDVSCGGGDALQRLRHRIPGH